MYNFVVHFQFHSNTKSKFRKMHHFLCIINYLGNLFSCSGRSYSFEIQDSLHKQHFMTHHQIFIGQLSKSDRTNLLFGEVAYKYHVKVFNDRTNKQKYSSDQIVDHNICYIKMLSMKKVNSYYQCNPGVAQPATFLPALDLTTSG